MTTTTTAAVVATLPTERNLGPVTNAAEMAISYSVPYTFDVGLIGTSDLLFHRWNCEAVAEKAAAAKGSKAKKTDDIKTFLYYDDQGIICIPGEYLRMAIIGAAKFRQDPRSPRKSAVDLYKAGIVSLTELAQMGLEKWDYEHKCRVQVQRNGITRTRPAFRSGWKAEFCMMVMTPEYIRPLDVLDAIQQAGKLIGIGDFRPTYGRFNVTNFRVRDEMAPPCSVQC